MQCAESYLVAPYSYSFVYKLVYAFTGIISSLVNITALLTLSQKSYRRKDSNVMLILLAIYNLLLSAFCSTLQALVNMKGSTVTKTSCVVHQVAESLFTLFVVASWTTMCVIAQHRYSCIKSSTLTQETMKTIHLITRVLLTICIPVSVEMMRYVFTTAFFVAFTLCFFLGFITLIVFYRLIICETKKCRKQMASQTSSDNCSITDKQKRLREIRLSKKVTNLILAYAICALPSILWIILRSLNIMGNSGKLHFINISRYMSFLNSTINPFIYLRSSDLKKGIKRLFCRK